LNIFRPSHQFIFKSQPSSGFGKFILLLSIASRKIRVSCALSSHPAHTNMNCMLKLQTAMTFCVGILFLPINGIWLSADMQPRTCVPAIAPTQFYRKKKIKNEVIINFNKIFHIKKKFVLPWNVAYILDSLWFLLACL